MKSNFGAFNACDFGPNPVYCEYRYFVKVRSVHFHNISKDIVERKYLVKVSQRIL